MTQSRHVIKSNKTCYLLGFFVAFLCSVGLQGAEGAETSIAPITSLAAGNFQTCITQSDGKAQCWGYNGYGQLGNGDTADSSLPVVVTGITTATSIATGGFHGCVRQADSRVLCWGDNDFGQLGNSDEPRSTTPMMVSGITTATAIATGYSYSCALLGSGRVQCWGKNERGQLGDGTTKDANTPMFVLGVGTAIAMATGREHTCALLENGRVRCWGANSSGQLGTEPPLILRPPCSSRASRQPSGLPPEARTPVRCWRTGVYVAGAITLMDSLVLARMPLPPCLSRSHNLLPPQPSLWGDTIAVPCWQAVLLPAGGITTGGSSAMGRLSGQTCRCQSWM